MLGTRSINLQLAERRFGNQQQVGEKGTPAGLSRPVVPSGRSRTKMSPTADTPTKYPSPIAGCDKVYQGSRGGWDAHVGSLRIHPGWHPELESAEDRKRIYQIDFPEFIP